uniref:Lipoprotein LPP20-like domain-containing protein n=1 Tax=Cereibacter sphaeroides (strain ATCC 17025 / ATH 2.4.3) TaxID=349102 RepID=A4WSZ8_CERS5
MTGIGFSQVAGQPGRTLNERRLMAMRAARLDAMRDLAEQVHGLRLDSRTTVRDAVAVNDQIAGAVSGSIRGARLVRITPKGEDSYEVELALDADAVGYIVKAARQR